jgi:hypothetical protein
VDPSVVHLPNSLPLYSLSWGCVVGAASGTEDEGGVVGQFRGFASYQTSPIRDILRSFAFSNHGWDGILKTLK